VTQCCWCNTCRPSTHQANHALGALAKACIQAVREVHSSSKQVGIKHLQQQQQ
jgi:hypothetical protein